MFMGSEETPDFLAGKGKRPIDPYQRIIWAAKRGTGCTLSAEECHDMRFDAMIENRAIAVHNKETNENDF